MATADVAPIVDENRDLLKRSSELKETLRLEKSRLADTYLSEATADVEELNLDCPLMNMRQRRFLRGHQRRVFHFDWCMDNRHVISGAEDTFAYVWDGFTSHKEFELQLQEDTSVTACAYAPTETVIALGGMNCKCVVYQINSRDTIKSTQSRHTVATHNSYITGCNFLKSDQQLLTSSADRTCALWDVERQDPVLVFRGHSREVMGIDVHPRDTFSVFASAGSDHCIRIWDIRTGQCTMKFETHDGEVNSVRFFPTNDSIGSASNDATCRLFDLRADQEVCIYNKASIVFGASSLDFSKSGRILFAGYNDYTLRAWDTLKETHLGMWIGHRDRISHVKMSSDGMALCTSSWDGTLAIWA